MSTIINCSYCSRPTGAHFVDGDPYFPTIICDDCNNTVQDQREREELAAFAAKKEGPPA